MTDVLVSALVSAILGNLNSLVLKEFGVAGGLKTELENLESTLTTIQAVLQDAEEKQWKSEAVKNWLRKLKDVAYDADDVVEEFAVEAQRRQRQRNLTNRVRSFFSPQNLLAFRVKMAHGLKSIRDKLDVIAKERQDFHLREGLRDVEVESLDWRQTSSLVNESEIYGRYCDKTEIINVLLANLDGLLVLAICGMGGIGKTTLAQLIYNDGRVEEHYDLRIWVCVSNDFDTRRLARAIIESIEGSPCNIQELDPLLRCLQEKLRGRKFLLVLDDVWDHYNEKWNVLKDTLKCGAKESATIITTRIETVGLKMATVPLRCIQRLSGDDCWCLFQERAFGMERRDEHVNLETIGKEIVKKCGGNPLAIKALGSLLRFKRKESEWLSIKESEIWDLQDEGSMILPALRLSYDHLPPHLRQCFAFCSIFPKDHVLRKDQLIELWMANGFIPCKGPVHLHEVGNEIFSELLWRSFFQDAKKGRWGDIVACKMHDLIHDLARSIMLQECCLLEPGQELEVPKKVRHLAVYNTTWQAAPWNKDLFNFQSLHSLILLNRISGMDSLLPYLFEQKRLRALDIYGCNIEKFAKSIGSLKHLRYLNLSWSSIKVLPEPFSSLQSLQTLTVAHCQKLYMLPKGMKHMKNLQYLDMEGCRALRCMPAGMGQLTCLRKLSLFIVGKGDGRRIKELSRLNHLEGDLTIRDLHNVKDLADAKNANLTCKKNLQSLKLYWHWRQDNEVSKVLKNSEEVLCGLQPHSNLKMLQISGYDGSKFPNWMMELLLPNLVEICLECCDNCTSVPPFEKLLFLKKLRLSRMNSVTHIISAASRTGEVAFPSLETLELMSLRNLEEWTEVGGRDIFPHLRKLTVFDCPSLVGLPLIPSVKILRIVRGNVTLIRSVMNFTSLTSLSIISLDELNPLPDGLLHNHTLLESLHINASSLKSLSNQLDNLYALRSLSLQICSESLPEGLGNLKSLKSLSLFGCQELISLPINGLCGLSSLCFLSIQSCAKFESLSEGVQYLTALEDLCLLRCPKLNSFSEGIQHLTSLKSLKITGCEELPSLPNQIEYLKSLSCLEIKQCPNLMCLPEGLQSLNMLRDLIIIDCPNLERRCKEEGGEDWPKIAHVPNIHINDRIIQSSYR
ncbi:hypothetical protein Peur_026944 [Populus x canadensis]